MSALELPERMNATTVFVDDNITAGRGDKAAILCGDETVTYTQLCNERGGIESDLTVARVAPDRFVLVTGTAFGVHDATWIRKHLPADGSVRLRDVTSSYAMLNVCGPNARRLLERTTGDDVSDGGFPFGQCRRIVVGAAPVLAMRVTYVGELGYELYMPPECACQVYEILWEAGEDLGVANAGYRAIESLRLEKGYRYWGSEVTPDYTPYDAGLGFCVDLSKEDFIGRDALAKAKADGPQWKLCCFTLDADTPMLLRGSETISRNGEVLGVVTSGGYGHTVGKTIAYGYLPAAEAAHDEGFEIEVYRETYAAVRHEGALYDPERKKILS